MATSDPSDASGIDNPVDALLGYQLRRASAVMFAALAHALEDVALKPTEGSVLLLIAANAGITQSEIGRTLAIKRANMAPIAALLTDRGLVERMRPDGRAQGLNLSKAGRSLAATVRQRIERHEARFLSGLTAAERETFIALVRRVWNDPPAA